MSHEEQTTWPTAALENGAVERGRGGKLALPCLTPAAPRHQNHNPVSE